MKNSLLLKQTNDEEVTKMESVRPLFLADFIGQDNIKTNIDVFVKSAIKRAQAMDHVLLYGPPGLGKTTLANIIANELGVAFKQTSGPVLSKAGDLAAILTNLKEYDVLFIDEIHRLNINVEEILYSAMEDYKIDVIIGEGPSARSITLPLKPFTLVGATTRLGLLSAPLRTRFGIPLNLEFYKPEILMVIVRNAAQKLSIEIDDVASYEIAKRSRGTPRIAIRLLRRIRDFALVSDTCITQNVVKDALTKLGVDEIGLDGADLRYLNLIAESYNCGPVGIDTIASSLSEDRGTIEDTIEDYLLQIGFIAKTPRGRILTDTCKKHLGIKIYDGGLI